MGERLGRRGFLKVAGLSALAFALGPSNRESIQELPGEIRDYIHVPERTVFNFQTEPDGNFEPYEVETHPEGFYRALRYIANYEDPLDGVNKLHGFLMRNPLTIDFAERLTGPWGEESAHFTPSFWPGGPRILFTQYFMNDYFRIEQSGEPGGRLTFDALNVWHELYHAWQEIRNPAQNMWEAFQLYLWAYTSRLQFSQVSIVSFSPSAEGSVKTSGKEPVKTSEKGPGVTSEEDSGNAIPAIEAEPRRECWQILLECMERVRNQYYKDGHLEHFFTFSRLDDNNNDNNRLEPEKFPLTQRDNYYNNS